MNKDGKLDIVTANTSTLNVTVCLSTGVGTFGNPINQNAGTNPSGLFVTDLNGDKAMDVVVANTTSTNVSVPVSYTHLDVYKRQALRFATMATPPWTCSTASR